MLLVRGPNSLLGGSARPAASCCRFMSCVPRARIGMQETNRAQPYMLEFIDKLAAMARDDPRQLREAGAIAPLVSMLMSNQPDVSSRAAKVLRDLAETSSETKHEITQLQRVLGFTLKVKTARSRMRL